MREVWGRLAGALLVVLLAVPAVAPDSRPVADGQASPAQDGGMAATPAEAAAASLAATPASTAAPTAAPIQRERVGFHPLLGRLATRRTSRLPVAAKPAPTVLRV